MNHTEAFQIAIRNAGLEPPVEIRADGTLYRFHVSDDSPHSKNGWYVLHDGTPATGAFGCWKRGISETWCSREFQSLSLEEKSHYEARVELIRKQRKEEQERVHAECQSWCSETWKKSKDATNDMTYLQAKGVNSYGLKIFNESLIIPVQDMAGRLHGLQFIAPDGSKKFKTGTNKAGHFFKIGRSKDQTIIICEGYATGASIHQATGHAVVVAFDAGNLLSVVQNILSKYPEMKIIIAADNDQWTEKNPGLTKATEAARRTGSFLSVPKFKDMTTKPTDFNDLHNLEGLDAVRCCIDAAEKPVSKIDTPLERDMLPLTRLGDLLKEPEEAITWLVEGLLPSGGFSIIAAKPKVGKSTLARYLALCVARGEDFLGRSTQEGPVIYLALEDKRDEVRRHFKDMGATGEEPILIFSGRVPGDAIYKITKAIQEEKPVLLIIDPLFRFTKVKDIKDYSETTAKLEPLLMLARESGIHVACLHHNTKAEGNGGDGLLGSIGIFSSVDTLITLKRSRDYRTIESIQRYGEDLSEAVLVFDKGTRTVTLGDSKEETEICRVKEVLTEYLLNKAGSVTEAVIDSEVEGRRSVRKKALRSLVVDGRVAREGHGGKGDPFKYILVPRFPDIYREPQNQNPEMTETCLCESIYSGSSSSAFSEKPQEPQSMVSTVENENMTFVDTEDF